MSCFVMVDGKVNVVDKTPSFHITQEVKCISIIST